MLKKLSDVKNKIESLKGFFQIKGAECPIYKNILLKYVLFKMRSLKIVAGYQCNFRVYQIGIYF